MITRKDNLRPLAQKKRKKINKWIEIGRQRALTLFHSAATRVPAYRDFLKKNRVREGHINTWDDFKNLPLINKKNYLRAYPLKDLCWDGTLAKQLIFTSTSGSTGTSVYFPRQSKLDKQYSVIIENFLKQSHLKKSDATLVIICFGMGVWIGGLITYKAFEIAAERLDTSLSIITPGINKQEIFSVLKNLAPNYKNIILVGYPPFIKDVVDEASLQGIKLKDFSVRFLFAAEAFTEGLRNHLAKSVGIENVCRDMINIYGSADIGAMAYETGISILAKRLALKNKKLFHQIFTSIVKTPTLAQFNPDHIMFEEVNNEVILTGDNALPLIRYAIGDHGGVFSYDDLSAIFEKKGIDLNAEIKSKKIANNIKFPFVYVYERNDFSTTIYGLQVYPETIREVLCSMPFSNLFSGKLTMITRFDKQQDQYIELNIETRKGAKLTDHSKQSLISKIEENLLRKNFEFNELNKYVKNRKLLKCIFWPAEDPTYFKPGIKQKWVVK